MAWGHREERAIDTPTVWCQGRMRSDARQASGNQTGVDLGGRSVLMFRDKISGLGNGGGDSVGLDVPRTDF